MKATANSMKSSRRLRREMSLPEALLWRLLRRSPNGLKFRRQYAFGPFVADFYCPSARLVIEIDGAAHDFEQQAVHDEDRDYWMREQGVSVRRIAAGDVLRDPTAVAESILSLCAEVG